MTNIIGYKNQNKTLNKMVQNEFSIFPIKSSNSSSVSIENFLATKKIAEPEN